VNKRQAIPDEVFSVEKHKTPKFSMLPKGTVGANMLGQVTLEKYPATPSTGILDGAPVTSFRKQVKESADVCGQLFREPWAVTRLADVTESAGVKDQVGDARAWAMRRIRRQIEIQIGSNTDQTSQSGETPWTTRGMLQWLLPTAQASRPVPENFRPASATRFTSAMNSSTLTEAAVQALFLAAYNETKDPLDLDMFVGATVKQLISNLTQADPYRVEGTDELKNKVMVVSFDFGYARVHLDPFIAWDPATGESTAYSALSGVGINLSQWKWEWIKNNPPANVPLPADGSGVRGYIDCVGRLWSLNPQGQFSIYSGAIV
jgi:hypothetical protein